MACRSLNKTFPSSLPSCLHKWSQSGVSLFLPVDTGNNKLPVDTGNNKLPVDTGNNKLPAVAKSGGKDPLRGLDVLISRGMI